MVRNDGAVETIASLDDAAVETRAAAGCGSRGECAARPGRTEMTTRAGTRHLVVAHSLIAVALLGGCVFMPTAPMVAVLPGSTKPLDEFRMDDIHCRQYAQSTVAGPSQTASNNAAANAIGGAALGAAAGAIIGSVTGDAGAGAAIGAGTGLLFGSAAGANALGYSSYALQRQYDSVYVQCMYAHGNRVPARLVAYGSPMVGYPPPRSQPRNLSPSAGVPPDYRAPADGVPPDYRAPADSAPPGYPPSDSIPPPNTPAPR